MVEALQEKLKINNIDLEVNDVSVSYITPYPCDLHPEDSLTSAMEFLKGAAQYNEIQEIICKSQASHDVFSNTFWLFFTLRFQPGAFSDVVVFSRIFHIILSQNRPNINKK